MDKSTKQKTNWKPAGACIVCKKEIDMEKPHLVLEEQAERYVRVKGGWEVRVKSSRVLFAKHIDCKGGKSWPKWCFRGYAYQVGTHWRDEESAKPERKTRR